MIVGTAHLANPESNCHDMSVGDVFAPVAQSDIRRIVAGLARFEPTIVAVEASQDAAREAYARFLASRSEPSPCETEQIGFRLARTAGLSTVHGVDEIIDLPYGPVQDFAQKHGLSGIWDAIHSEVAEIAQASERLTRSSGLVALFRSMNEPSRIGREHEWYRRMLQIGAGSEQPGAEFLAAWYRRNALIFARIMQASGPGDRVLVLFGAGHAFLLRQAVIEMPGMTLVEPNDYLPALRPDVDGLARPTGVEPVSPA